MKTTYTFSLLSCILLLLCGGQRTNAQCFTWGYEGTQGFSGGAVMYTSIATDTAGIPYIAYSDAASGNKVMVRKYTGGTWGLVGIGAFSGGAAEHISIAINNSGAPYVAYMDASVANKVTVRRYTGTTWQTVGLAGFSAGKAEYISLAIDASGVPYVAYTDWANAKKVTVMKYNGSVWVPVGAIGFSAGQASYTRLTLNSSGVPYVVYKDNANGDKATVMRLNSATWVPVGAAGFSAGVADHTCITVANDTVVVAYSDWSIGRKANSMKYDGTAWVAAGGAGISPDRADNLAMTRDGAGMPYMCYTDWLNGDKTTVVRYKAGNWELLGAADFTAGATSYGAIAVSRGNAVYTAYTDGSMSGYASVMKFDNGVAPIMGNFSLCSSPPTTLTSYTPGGTWSSSNPSVATVGSSTGIVNGTTPGTTTISYTVAGGCGPVSATVVVTVNASASPITGTLAICTGTSTTLASATPGGVWYSLTPGVATISSSGVVSGLVGGTTTISYTVTGACGTATVVTVHSMPGFILGPSTVCVGATATASSATAGGVWTSTNTTVATIGSSTGLVNGGVVGTTIISYTTAGVCTRTMVMTVNPNPPAITGTMEVCATSNTPLSNASAGGIWMSSNTAIATVVSSTGIVVGVAPGTATISYHLAGGCYTTAVVTVHAMPSAITGAATVCVGSTAIMSSLPVGGNWSTSDPAIATVNTTGLVTGIAAGNVDIVYAFPTGCTRTLHFNVGPSPSAILAPATICEGASTTMSSYPAGGTWSSSTTHVSVGSATGGLTGLTTGVATIIYTLGAGCQQTTVVTVTPSPTPISGPSVICTGSSMPYTSSAGGTWSSGHPALATVGSTTGIVTGLIPGALFISYTLPTGCYRYTTITVTSTPAAAAVTGTSTVCVGATSTLSASITGGIWSITTGKVSVSATGVITGVASGVDTVKYSIPTVCGLITSSRPVTVNGMPSAGTIIGPTELCKNTTITLSSTVTGGTWKSSNITLAVVSTTGDLTGILAGTITISYRVANVCGADTATTDITIFAPPVAGTVSGMDSVCTGDTTRLTSNFAGGSWSSMDATLATIDGDGLITGVANGAVTFRYIVSNLCGADTATHMVYVKSSEACATGVKETAGVVQMKIFPNPNNGALTVETPIGGVLSIHTIDGKEVGRYEIDAPATSFKLPVGLTAGLYMCRFVGADGSSTVVRLVYEP